MTATAPAADRSRLPTLTGMRFIAAFLVFLGHASAEHLFADPDVDAKYSRVVEGSGYLGVSFFFILSGFVLTWSARPGDTVRKFWRRRAAKIYPSTVAAVLLAWLCLSITGQAVEADVLVPNLLLVQTWVPDIATFLGVNAPTWSLGCEVFFYALFPLLLPLLRRIPARHLWTAATLLVAAVAALPLAARLLPGTPMFPPPVSESFPRFWFVYGFPPARTLEFALGIVMALIVRSGRWVRLGMGPAALLALVAFVSMKYTSTLYTIVAVSAAPLALLVAAAAVADLEGRRSPFRSRAALWLGEASFAFYLVHQPVLTYGHRALGLGRRWDTPGAAGVLVLLLTMAVAVAGILYTAVERPSVRHLARSLKADAQGRPPGWFASRLLAELAQLTADETAVISAAAMLGDRFRLDDLTEVAVMDPDPACRATKRLCERDLLRPAGTGDHLTFRHPLVREVVFATSTSAGGGRPGAGSSPCGHEPAPRHWNWPRCSRKCRPPPATTIRCPPRRPTRSWPAPRRRRSAGSGSRCARCPRGASTPQSGPNS